MAVHLLELPQLQKLVQEPRISLCRVRQPDPVPQCPMHIWARLWLVRKARTAMCWARAGLMRGWAAPEG